MSLANNFDDSSIITAVRYRDVAYREEDDSSVVTYVASNYNNNNSIVQSRRTMVKHWGPALMLFGAAILVINNHRDGGSEASLLSQHFAQTARRTSIMTPYNTSTDMLLPSWTDAFANVWDDDEDDDATPFFWSVPRSGGSTLLNIFSHCLDLTLASNYKGTETGNSTLGVYEKPKVEETESLPFTPSFVNVKTDNEYWIRKCKDRELIESGLADVFETQHLVYAADKLFDASQQQARGMVMMRHPVKRIIDEFQTIQNKAIQHDAEHPNTVTLKEFVKSDEMVENYLVRVLNGITDSASTVTAEHVALAKEILKRKFIVGIFEWFDVSMVRFEKVFGWWEEMEVLTNMTINNCHYSLIEAGEDDTAIGKINDADTIYTQIMKRSWADIELYHYAKELFAEQAKLL